MVIQEEDNVMILTEKNFHQVVTEDANVLICFYASWSGHWKALEPEYAKAAEKLKEEGSDIRLAKIDATVETKLAEQFVVQGFPTLKFMKKGERVEYSGGRTEPEIVNWLKKKTGSLLRKFTNLEELQAFIEKQDVAVISFFQDNKSDGFKIFESVAKAVDDVEVGCCFDDPCATHYGVTDGTVLLFSKDSARSPYTLEPGFTKETLQTFVEVYSYPLFPVFSDERVATIFGGSMKNFLLLLDSPEPGDPIEREIITGIAEELRGRVLPVYVPNIPDNGGILEFLRFSPDRLPVITIIDLNADSMLKYYMTEPCTPDNLRAFVAGWEAGTIPRYLISEEIPES